MGCRAKAGRTRAEANGVGPGVDCIDCHDSCCQLLILGLALNAGRAPHEGAAVLLDEVHWQHCSHLHPSQSLSVSLVTGAHQSADARTTSGHATKCSSRRREGYIFPVAIATDARGRSKRTTCPEEETSCCRRRLEMDSTVSASTSPSTSCDVHRHSSDSVPSQTCFLRLAHALGFRPLAAHPE